MGAVPPQSIPATPSGMAGNRNLDRCWQVGVFVVGESDRFRSRTGLLMAMAFGITTVASNCYIHDSHATRVRNWGEAMVEPARSVTHRVPIEFLPEVVPRYTNGLEASRQVDLRVLGVRWTGFAPDGTV